MGDKVIIEILVFQAIALFVLIGIIMYLFKTSKSIKYEKRIGDFSLSSINDTELSFFDRVNSFIWAIIHKFGNILCKSKILNKYSKRYDKHITFDERNKKSSKDYLAIKFLLAFLLVFLNVLITVFKYTEVNIVSYLITFLIGFFSIDIYLALEWRKKRQQIEDDLLRAVIIMNNAFKAGRNIMQSVDLVKNELSGPIADEFQKISLDITYGLSLEVAFSRFYERVKLEEAKYIASSLTLLNKTGGNIVVVFASIERTFLNKRQMKQELQSLTAASNFVFKLLLLMPVIFIAIILILNRTYFKPLYTSVIGIIISILIVLLYALYIVVIRKVMKVDIE